MGRSVTYKFIKKPISIITLYIYPNYISEGKNINDEIENSLTGMIYSMKKNPTTSKISRNEKNFIKTIKNTKIIYNRLTVNEEKNEHIYISRINNQVVKLRATSTIGQESEILTDIYVGRILGYLKVSLTGHFGKSK